MIALLALLIAALWLASIALVLNGISRGRETQTILATIAFIFLTLQLGGACERLIG